MISEVMQAVQMIAWKKANVWKNKIIRKVLIQRNEILKMKRITKEQK